MCCRKGLHEEGKLETSELYEQRVCVRLLREGVNILEVSINRQTEDY